MILFTVIIIYWIVKKLWGNSQEQFQSANVSMNETLISSSDIHQVRLSVKKQLRRRRSSQFHRGNATIWSNHRMMRAELKNMIVLPTTFARSLGKTDGKMWRLGSVRYIRWIYLPKVLWQGRYFRRWWFFFSILILNIKTIVNLFSYGKKEPNFCIKILIALSQVRKVIFLSLNFSFPSTTSVFVSL